MADPIVSSVDNSTAHLTGGCTPQPEDNGAPLGHALVAPLPIFKNYVPLAILPGATAGDLASGAQHAQLCLSAVLLALSDAVDDTTPEWIAPRLDLIYAAIMLSDLTAGMNEAAHLLYSGRAQSTMSPRGVIA